MAERSVPLYSQQSNHLISALQLCALLEFNLTAHSFPETENEMILPRSFSLFQCGAAQKFNLR